MEWILCLAREGAVEEILTEAHKDWRNQRKNPDPRALQCFRSH